jgi:hypothetical protein
VDGWISACLLERELNEKRERKESLEERKMHNAPRRTG